jgi:multidrug efflux pump subunit AcrB
VNPNDIDKLITEKIERKIKNISGIKKFNSVSRTGISTTSIILNKDTDSTKFYSELQSILSHISLPS